MILFLGCGDDDDYDKGEEGKKEIIFDKKI